MHTDGWGWRSFSTGSKRPGRAPAASGSVAKLERLPGRASVRGRHGRPRRSVRQYGTPGILVYDAWNRLVEVWQDDGTDPPDGTLVETGEDADTLLAECRYDGLHRRVKKTDKAASPDVTYDYYGKNRDGYGFCP